MRSRNASSTVNLLLAAQPLEFRRAAAYSAARKAAIPMQKRLKLYALYKQALEGDAPEAAPSWAQIIELAKHAAWSAVRGRTGACVARGESSSSWWGETKERASATPSS